MQSMDGIMMEGGLARRTGGRGGSASSSSSWWCCKRRVRRNQTADLSASGAVPSMIIDDVFHEPNAPFSLQRGELESILWACKSVSQQPSFDAACNALAQALSQVTQADVVVVYKVLHAEKVLQVVSTFGVRTVGAHDPLPLIDSCPPAHAAHMKRSVLVSKVDMSPQFKGGQLVPSTLAVRPHSMLCVPLFGGDHECVAVAQVMNIVRATLSPHLPAGVIMEGANFADRPLHEFGMSQQSLVEEIANYVGGEFHRLWQLQFSVATQTRFHVLLDLMRNVSSKVGHKEVIDQIISASYAILDAERITLFLVDMDTSELIIVQSLDAVGIRIPLDQGVAGYTATTGQAVNIPNAYDHPRFDPSVDVRTGFTTKSLLSFPIKNQYGHVVAVLQAVNKRSGGVFTQEDLALLEYMAGHAGVVLTKERLMDEWARAKQTSLALLQVVKLVSAEDDAATLIDGILEAAYDLLNAMRVTIFLVDPIKSELWIIVSKDAQGVRIPMGHGIAGYVAKTAEVVNIADAYEDGRFDASVDARTGFRTRSILCAPVCLPTGGPPLAVIQAVNKLPHGAFDSYDEQAITTFASEVAVALRRRTVETSMAKAVQDASSVRQMDISLSLLALYSDAPTSARLATTVGAAGQSSSDRAKIHTPLLQPLSTEGLLSWDFDPFTTTAASSVSLAVEIFQHFDSIRIFNLDRAVLAKFIDTVRQKYHPENPFHNWYHGFGVLHAAFMLLSTGGCCMSLSHLEVLCSLIAAVCHDVDHTGHTNMFEMASLSPLALTHSDDAVLERHHAHVTFQILMAPETALLSGLPKEQFAEARSLIIHSILATDMSKHAGMVQELALKLTSASISSEKPQRAPRSERARSVPSLPDRAELPDLSLKMSRTRSVELSRYVFDPSNAKDRRLVMDAVVHSADLSGQAYGHLVSQQWGARVIEEFKAQAKLERQLGLPVAPFMARLDEPIEAANVQISFVANVVTPLWSKMRDLFTGLETPVNNLNTSRLRYEAEKARVEADRLIEQELVHMIDAANPSNKSMSSSDIHEESKSN